MTIRHACGCRLTHAASYRAGNRLVFKDICIEMCPTHSATFDLLAALEELVDIVDDIIACGYAVDADLDCFTLQPARAAIAKAGGEHVKN